MTDRYEVIGVEASPYSVKVRAVMRYRRLAHTWLCRMPQFHPPVADVKPLLMPIVRFPDGGRQVDSTPIVLALEERHPSERSVLPDDPVLAFYARLIEDMADEWLTKCLFHYRFSFAEDAAFAALWVMDDTWPDIDAAELRDKAESFLARQTARMALVGVTPENAPAIERSLERALAALEPFVALDRFLFGSRPSLADFGLAAQLRTLCTDPTPAALIRRTAPRVEHWVRRMDDLSGVDGAWQSDAETNAAVAALLTLAGDTYLPFLQANARAREKGAEGFSVALADGTYSQAPFAYQVRCFNTLRAAFAELTSVERARAEPILGSTGCLEFLV